MNSPASVVSSSDGFSKIVADVFYCLALLSISELQIGKIFLILVWFISTTLKTVCVRNSLWKYLFGNTSDITCSAWFKLLLYDTQTHLFSFSNLLRCCVICMVSCHAHFTLHFQFHPFPVPHICSFPVVLRKGERGGMRLYFCISSYQN